MKLAKKSDKKQIFQDGGQTVNFKAKDYKGHYLKILSLSIQKVNLNDNRTRRS